MIDGGDDVDTRTGGLDASAPSARWWHPASIGGLASMGAGAVHAAAIGIHAEHPQLSRIFVLMAVAQLGAGLLLLLRSGRSPALVAVAVNAAAVAGWALTRTTGISWVDGLEAAEPAQFADTACAALGAIAAGAGVWAWRRPQPRPAHPLLAGPALAVGAVTVAAMFAGTAHVHDHGDASAAGAHDHGAGTDDHSHDDGASTETTHSHGAAAAATTHDHTQNEAADPATTDHAHDEAADPATTDHAHDDTAPAATHDHGTAEDPASAWPRPWDPSQPIDFSGVPGVTADQQGRAEALVRTSLADLPRFADVTAMAALGYHSIGDQSTGFEHYINYDYLTDDGFLDPTRPESLVYRVDGDARTLVSAMFIADTAPVDDPALVDYGGPLMQWHVHDNLCWVASDDGPKVVGVTDDAGGCPPGSVNAGGENPMVHVWITPHECGPFAALEGQGAGQTDPNAGPRTDQCGHDHGAAPPAPADPHPYDPTRPIDLSGTPGVTPEQQAFAENLVAVTVVRLPQWSDPAAAEAAGFHSIGDGFTGHEHYINWDWIDDDVWLDPDAPESLVYEPQPDGTKRLVSAMYMLPDTMTLDDVPDWGGALMQWHIHDNLCFTDDPVAPLVRGITNPDGTCSPPLVKLGEAPMIHVWIEPNACGPFAALEGLGAGSVRAGEEHLCDHVHGGG